ncbi:MAG: hypothetical protein P0Y56_13015 [Candidatus Andeanibacterium colombiense]|uniref:Uncharacterized protein n=1 Tax=Candidatus Andeanibacterium colombiense TaxID=3121345 RepID=A0AAJ6BP17_9SPHN|nr:MAG: hypothetical protein P0Y56_13015 [Sphingomonadaceae bacterium]
MIRASRRAVLGGALAVPTLSGLATWRWRHGDGRLLLHDPSLDAGRRFAEAGGASLAIEGDRIRFAREIFAAKPALVAGVSRHADLVLIADVAAEMGYVLAAEFEGRGQKCTASSCLPGWGALGRVANAAGQGWAEALGSWAANPGGAVPSGARETPARPDAGLALGWVLVPRG